jgi:hypothetical protein
VIADRAFDSNAFLALIKATGAEAVIPPLTMRRERHSYDRHPTANAILSSACSIASNNCAGLPPDMKNLLATTY